MTNKPTEQVGIRLTPEQVKQLDDIRASMRPILSLSELVRVIISDYLKNK